jgi:hypothetical protein
LVADAVSRPKRPASSYVQNSRRALSRYRLVPSLSPNGSAVQRLRAARRP